jgi:hypothetical protein
LRSQEAVSAGRRRLATVRRCPRVVRAEPRTDSLAPHSALAAIGDVAVGLADSDPR